jgi:hypothetical protein
MRADVAPDGAHVEHLAVAQAVHARERALDVPQHARVRRHREAAAGGQRPSGPRSVPCVEVLQVRQPARDT